jgi:hypothetical protein
MDLMPKFKISGCYRVTKYVDRYVTADSEDEAKDKAWSYYHDEEIEVDREEGDFEIGDVEMIEE